MSSLSLHLCKETIRMIEISNFLKHEQDFPITRLSMLGHRFLLCLNYPFKKHDIFFVGMYIILGQSFFEERGCHILIYDDLKEL